MVVGFNVLMYGFGFFFDSLYKIIVVVCVRFIMGYFLFVGIVRVMFIVLSFLFFRLMFLCLKNIFIFLG